MEDGLVFNAMDGAKKLGISPDELGKKYDALKKGETIIKFGGGFYCGKVDDIYAMVVLLIRFVQRIEGPMSWFFPIIIGVEGFNKEERDLVKKDVVVSWYCSWNGGNCIVLSAAILQRRIALEQIGEGVPDWEDEIIEQALDVFEYLGGAVCTRMFLLFFFTI